MQFSAMQFKNFLLFLQNFQNYFFRRMIMRENGILPGFPLSSSLKEFPAFRSVTVYGVDQMTVPFFIY